MAYVSLYRKYRSRTFDEIVGQDHITTTLKNAISNNRIGHAYLFSGTRGTGKTSTARIFSKALNCSRGPTPTPCNECDICTAINTDSLFDVVEIDAASNRGIEDIRDLREKVRVPPSQSRYKVYIIDEVHMLTKEAFNALLKTLEEPPSYVVFMMATTEPQKLLSTILSRCQRFDFRRLTDDEIAGHIRWIAGQENFEIEDEALVTIVSTADGSMRDSISILDQLVSFSNGKVTSADVNSVFGLVERREIQKFMATVFSGDAGTAFELFDGFFQAGKSFSLFIRYLMEHVRDLYLIKQGIRPSRQIYSDEDLKPMKKQAAAVPRRTLAYMLDEMSRVEDRIRWETYPRIVLEVFVVRLLDIVSGPPLQDGPPGEKPAAKKETGRQEDGGTTARKAETPEPAPEKPPAPKKRPEKSSRGTREPPVRPKRLQSEEDQQNAVKKDDTAPTDDEPPIDVYEQEATGTPPAAPRGPASVDPVDSVEMPPEFEYPPVEDPEPKLPDNGDGKLVELAESWKDILLEVKKINLPSYFFVAQGMPAQLDGTHLVLEFDRDHRYHMEQATEQRNKKTLEQALEKVLGKSYAVRCRTAATEGEEQAEENIEEEQAEDSKTAHPGGQDKAEEKEGPADSREDAAGEKSAPQTLSLFDTFTEVFPNAREID